MPTIPQYNSQGNVQATPNAVMRNEAKDMFAPQKEVTKTLVDVNQQWSDANDVMQFTEAKANYEVAAAQIKSEAAADPDFNNSHKYISALSKAQGDSLKGISNQQIAQKAALEFNFSSNISAMNIQAQFDKKKISHNEVVLDTGIDELAQQASFGTPLERIKAREDIKQLVDFNVLAGNISEADGIKRIEDAEETIVKYAIYNDIATEEKESQVLAELKNPKGEYSFLSTDNRLKLIKQSQDRIFQNNQTLKNQYKIDKNNRIESIYQSIDAETFTFSDLDSERERTINKDGIQAKTLNMIEKGMRAELLNKMPLIATKNEDSIKFINAMTDYVDNIDDQNKIMEYIAKSYEVGGLNPKEAVFLENMQAQASGIKNARERTTFMNNKFIPFKNSIIAIRDWVIGSPLLSEEDHAGILSSFIKGLSKGKETEKSRKEAIHEAEQRLHPEYNDWEEGVIRNESIGPVKKIGTDYGMPIVEMISGKENTSK